MNIRDNGIRGGGGPVLVVYEDEPDRHGDPVPVVSLDYDPAKKRVEWRRNKRPGPDDVRWEQTDWKGVEEALVEKGLGSTEIREYVEKNYGEVLRLLASGISIPTWWHRRVVTRRPLVVDVAAAPRKAAPTRRGHGGLR
jgi:hypothetical protein